MIPGEVVGIFKDQVLAIESHGLRDEIQPMNSETSFDMGSVTKILSTTAILMRWMGEKKVNINSQVADYLPAWNSNSKSKITLQDLLQHRSGLNEWAPFYLKFSKIDDVHQYIAESDLKYPIGDGRHYSDLGFITLGKVIETIAGERIDHVFKSEIAEPLQLTNTQYASPVDGENVAATSLGDRFEKKMVETGIPYSIAFDIPSEYKWREHRLTGEVNDGNCFKTFNSVSGHAGLFSTVSDMVKFGRTLFESNSVFSPEVINAFLTPSADEMQMSGFRSWHKGQYVGHTGFPGVALAVDRNNKRVIALATNRLATDGELVPTDDLLEKYL